MLKNPTLTLKHCLFNTRLTMHFTFQNILTNICYNLGLRSVVQFYVLLSNAQNKYITPLTEYQTNS